MQFIVLCRHPGDGGSPLPSPANSTPLPIDRASSRGWLLGSFGGSFKRSQVTSTALAMARFQSVKGAGSGPAERCRLMAEAAVWM